MMCGRRLLKSSEHDLLHGCWQFQRSSKLLSSPSQDLKIIHGPVAKTEVPICADIFPERVTSCPFPFHLIS